MSESLSHNDTRTPSPPYGYSRECHHSREQQMHIVAEYHAHKIRPSRIAYRVGIDIAFIEALIAGEEEAERFPGWWLIIGASAINSACVTASAGAVSAATSSSKKLSANTTARWISSSAPCSA
ncbi:hypothetical protein [Halioglobus japonicus]|uniref:hypothetical protein n=1 Tax=Halioglobus japonicus TaxID=930805 RepID=UPI00197B06D3|nr:hypothetical protein [Halioglobus japonicus]